MGGKKAGALVGAYFIHIANVIYLASYAVKNMLALRLLTVLGIVTLIPYYMAHHLADAVVWNVLFLGINIYRLRGARNGNPRQA